MARRKRSGGPQPFEPLPPELRFFKFRPQPPREGYVTSQWGELSRYFEMGDDGFAVRHVDIFANGYLLRYDRHHWTDQFGTLADKRWSSEWRTWWGEPIAIDASEFETLWELAGRSPMFKEQMALTEPTCEGAPPWITIARQTDDRTG